MDRMGIDALLLATNISFTFIHLKQIFGTEMYNILAINAGILWPIDLWKCENTICSPLTYIEDKETCSTARGRDGL